MTDLGPTAGQAYGINRSGRVVGATGSTPRATVWVNGQKRLWGPAGTVSAGFGVNAAGLVVGVIQASSFIACRKSSRGPWPWPTCRTWRSRYPSGRNSLSRTTN
jgi:hypothetical protein